MPAYTVQPRRALLRGDLPDNFTRCLYRIAPYKGCAHGCRYCDGRAEKYYVEGDFERDIEIRSSIPELLAKEIPKLREQGIVALGSGVTDPYQPHEKIENISGRCANLLAKHNIPALVMTKSALVLRDINSWSDVNINAGFILLMSITSTDETIREAMEPGASSFVERIETLKQFKEAGCITGVLAMPFLPGISDSLESIRNLYSTCAAVNVDFVMPGGLTLRPGRQKELYLKTLRSFRPNQVDSTLDMYREDRLSGMPSVQCHQVLMKRIEAIRKEFNIPWLLPHKYFSRLLPSHDSFRVLLRDMLELYASQKVDIGPLRKSANKYDTWLLDLRRFYRRKRSLPNSWFSERLHEAVDTGELDRVLDNPRLSQFAHTVLTEGAILDYSTLKLSTGMRTT